MDWDRIQQKLHILSDAAKYDGVLSSSGQPAGNQAGHRMGCLRHLPYLVG